MGTEQWARKFITGAKCIIQIEKLFASLVKKIYPVSLLSCIDIDTVVCVKIAICVDTF